MTWLLVTRYPLVAQRWRFWASFPGIHIAQFPFQVIANCGVISLMQRSNRQLVAIRWSNERGDVGPDPFGPPDKPFERSCVHNWPWRYAHYDGIVAEAAAR